jgi:hypothetical protein
MYRNHAQLPTHISLSYLSKCYRDVGSIGQAARVVTTGINCLETIISNDIDRGSTKIGVKKPLRSIWKLLGDLSCFARNLGPSDILDRR